MHLSGYQARDLEVVDYQMFKLPGTELQFRGPAIDLSSNQKFFTCLGAAQTFGCFCESPYPDLLSQRIGLPALNLGYGGAGPEFFAGRHELFDYINRGEFAVIQVMSGRSQSNSRYACDGLEFMTRRSDGMSIGAREAYAELLAGPEFIRNRIPGRMGELIARIPGRWQTKKVVSEVRAAWVENYRTLLKRITVPTILLWFSKRSPDYRERWSGVTRLFGAFPQLVNQQMIDQIRPHCDDYVECISDRGSPQPLVSRHTGQPVTVNPANDRADLREGDVWTHNRYYPSPEMHVDATQSLAETCARHLEGLGQPA